MKVGRNEPCPCGSGKKYKVCCSLKADSTTRDPSKLGLLIVGAVLALGLGGFAWSIATTDSLNDGRVWSAEHGHWHNADGTEIAPAAGTPVPQPPGPAPEGKVWSPEHGHWHDA